MPVAISDQVQQQLTVNGPGDFSVSTSPAVATKSTRVEKLPAATAVSTISGLGGMSTWSIT